MIIQSLVSLYDRLKKDDEVPPFGFSVENIGFAITIDKSGNLVGDPEDLRNQIKPNVYEYFPSTVPYSNKVNVRSSGAANTPNYMVDKADFIFGMSGNVSKEKHHQSFKALIEEVSGDSKDEGIIAVRKFLENWNTDLAVTLKHWKEISGTHGKWIAFQLDGERGFVHERPEVKRLWAEYVHREENPIGRNIIDGKDTPLQCQYSQFKFGSGASLVSFNESAYWSYGKKRGKNAPISVKGEFKSSSAMKYLLRNPKQRLKIGDATTIFWTENDSPVEEYFGMILNPKDNETNQELELFLNAARKGKRPAIPGYAYNGDVKFYILGLSLNKARLAVRFWYICTVDTLVQRIGAHFRNLEMERAFESEPLNPGIRHLLKATARERDTKNISPILGGALMRAILEGTPYPLNLLNGVIRRIRAEQSKKDSRTGKSIQNVNYFRAAIIKAVLTRNYKMEVPMSLDTENKDEAYLLGRLFAVLEKAQQGAIPGANATIKDRFYGSASATPASVFPRLLHLATHHYKKAKFGGYYESIVAEIIDYIDSNGFPNHMNLRQQGMFSIGYYHQRNALWRKKEIEEEVQEVVS